MKLTIEAQRHGQVVEELTIIGKLIKKAMVFLNDSHVPYEGKVIREGIEYRPTIPRLFFYLLRFWLMRKKSDFTHDSN